MYTVHSGVVANLELGERSGSGGRAPSGVQGQSPWSGGRGRSPPEAESFFVFEPFHVKVNPSPQNSN